MGPVLILVIILLVVALLVFGHRLLPRFAKSISQAKAQLRDRGQD